MKKLFENVGGNQFKISKESHNPEMKEYEPEMEQFENWIKKAQPGLSPNELAYDIAKEAYFEGYREGGYAECYRGLHPAKHGYSNRIDMEKVQKVIDKLKKNPDPDI